MSDLREALEKWIATAEAEVNEFPFADLLPKESLRAILDAHPPVRAQVEITDEAATLVGEAWDDGNAMGLDGYVGPNRGAGDVDPEAERARERMVDRAAALPYLVPRPLLNREAVIQALAIEANSWPMDAGLPHHPDDAKVVQTFARLADAVLSLLGGES